MSTPPAHSRAKRTCHACPAGCLPTLPRPCRLPFPAAGSAPKWHFAGGAPLRRDARSYLADLHTVAVLLVQNHTPARIARKTGIALRTVYRHAEKLEQSHVIEPVGGTRSPRLFQKGPRWDDFEAHLRSLAQRAISTEPVGRGSVPDALPGFVTMAPPPEQASPSEPCASESDAPSEPMLPPAPRQPVKPLVLDDAPRAGWTVTGGGGAFDVVAGPHADLPWTRQWDPNERRRKIPLTGPKPEADFTMPFEGRAWRIWGKRRPDGSLRWLGALPGPEIITTEEEADLAEARRLHAAKRILAFLARRHGLQYAPGTPIAPMGRRRPEGKRLSMALPLPPGRVTNAGTPDVDPVFVDGSPGGTRKELEIIDGPELVKAVMGLPRLREAVEHRIEAQADDVAELRERMEQLEGLAAATTRVLQHTVANVARTAEGLVEAQAREAGRKPAATEGRDADDSAYR